MAREITTQPMVKDADNLAIGLMQVRVAEVTDAAGYPFTDDVGVGDAVSDAVLAPAYLDDKSIGAIQNAGLKAQPTFKEHASGYPKTTDVQMIETTAAEYNVDAEEFISGRGFAMLQNILDTLNTGTPHYYGVSSMSQFATGNTLNFYTPIASLKPSLALNITNDWGSLPVTFEAVYRDDLTNKELVYWHKDTSVTARADTYQPITLTPDDLVIGKMQFRVGGFATREATTMKIYAVRKVVGLSTSVLVSDAKGTYTGAVDGAFIITITLGGADGTATYAITNPDGTAGTPGTVTNGGDADLALGDGVTVDFEAGTYVKDDVYVVGVESAAALASAKANVACPYPYLPSTASIGAVTSTEITSDITYKEHKSGYPEKLTLSMVEAVSIKATAAVEEMDFTDRPTTNGYATKMSDAILDSSTSGTLYYVPLEVVITSVSGKTLSLWYPNTQLLPNAEFSPADDFANLSVSFSALKPGITGLNTVYAYVNG